MSSLFSQRKKVRSLVVQCLYEWQMSGNDMVDIITNTQRKTKAQLDVDYFRQALHIIVSQHADLDAAFSPYLDIPLDQIDPIELAVLRLATYEFMFRPDVPYRVVINEALDNAKRFGGPDSHKFINGVLDKLAKQLRAAEQQM